MSATDDMPCLLVAEVSGSALLHEKLGAAEAQHAVLRCRHRMERAAAGFNGKLQEARGDAMLIALFESAESAHLAGQEMQQRVLDLPPVSGVKLAVQLGLATDMSQAARLAGQARPGQILLGMEARNALPQMLQSSTFIADPGGEIFEVLWQQPVVLSTARLTLHQGGTVLSLGSDKPEAAMGRDLQNDIVIRNPRVSRIHARIELRRDNFVLTDQSRNGTFVGFVGSPEIALMREEVILRGSGYISCGCSYGPETDELVEFDCSAVEGP